MSKLAEYVEQAQERRIRSDTRIQGRMRAFEMALDEADRGFLSLPMEGIIWFAARGGMMCVYVGPYTYTFCQALYGDLDELLRAVAEYLE